jgi:hypothetical protein
MRCFHARQFARVHALRMRTLELMPAAGQQCRELADVRDRARCQSREVPSHSCNAGFSPSTSVSRVLALIRLSRGIGSIGLPLWDCVKPGLVRPLRILMLCFGSGQ